MNCCLSRYPSLFILLAGVASVWQHVKLRPLRKAIASRGIVLWDNDRRTGRRSGDGLPATKSPHTMTGDAEPAARSNSLTSGFLLLVVVTGFGPECCSFATNAMDHWNVVSALRGRWQGPEFALEVSINCSCETATRHAFLRCRERRHATSQRGFDPAAVLIRDIGREPFMRG